MIHRRLFGNSYLKSLTNHFSVITTCRDVLSTRIVITGIPTTTREEPVVNKQSFITASIIMMVPEHYLETFNPAALSDTFRKPTVFWTWSITNVRMLSRTDDYSDNLGAGTDPNKNKRRWDFENISKSTHLSNGLKMYFNYFRV